MYCVVSVTFSQTRIVRGIQRFDRGSYGLRPIIPLTAGADHLSPPLPLSPWIHYTPEHNRSPSIARNLKFLSTFKHFQAFATPVCWPMDTAVWAELIHNRDIR